MVENTGKALHVGAYKQVNTPEPIAVEKDSNGFPVTIKLSPWQSVITIEDHWRIDDEWWRSEPVSRLYFKVQLASEQQLMLYHDLMADSWYRQSY